MINIKNYKAFIFDLDGTLIDSMWVWKQIDIDFLGERKIVMPPALQKRIEGMSMYETAKFFKETLELEDSIEQLIDIWNEMALERYKTKVKLKEGAKEFLEFLNKNNIPCAIATSNSRLLVEAVLSSCGIKDLIPVIVTSDEVNKGKPAPDVYLTAAKKLGVDPGKCFVFEDLQAGIDAAHNAGMTACLIYDENSVDDLETKKESAEYFINNFKDLNYI